MTTKPNRYFSEQSIAKALGIEHQLLADWSARGNLSPEIVQSAHADSRIYPASEVLAIAVTMQLRAKGLPLSMIVPICNFLRSRSIDEMEAEWQAGRRFILSVGDCEPLLTLLSHEAIYDNPGIDLKAAAAAGVDVRIVDVAEAYRQLTSKIAAHTASRRAEHARRIAESPFAHGRRQRYLKAQAERRAKPR